MKNTNRNAIPFIMEKAKVYKGQRGYCVRLWWKGKKLYFSKFYGYSVTKDKRNAERLADSINESIANKRFNPDFYKRSKEYHLKEYSCNWLDAIKENVSTATYHDYSNSLKNHILPLIGDKFISDINRGDIKHLINNIKRKPKGKKNVISCLRTLLQYALDNNDINQMPDFGKLFSGKNQIIDPEITYISQEQQVNILKYIPLDDRYIFLFGILTGCRVSEARAFRKVDIDYNKNQIRFAKTFGRMQELKEVKGKKVMPFPLVEPLRFLFDIVPQNDTDYVFVYSKTQKPYTKNINRDLWNPACRALGINISLNHGFRHSFACNLLNNGVDKGIVSRLLRHQDLRMIDKYGMYDTQVLGDTVNTVQDNQWTTMQKLLH